MQNANLINSLLGATASSPAASKSRTAKPDRDSALEFQNAMAQQRTDIAAKNLTKTAPKPNPVARDDGRPAAKPGRAEAEVSRPGDRALKQANNTHPKSDTQLRPEASERSSAKKNVGDEPVSDQDLPAEVQADTQGALDKEEGYVSSDDLADQVSATTSDALSLGMDASLVDSAQMPPMAQAEELDVSTVSDDELFAVDESVETEAAAANTKVVDLKGTESVEGKPANQDESEDLLGSKPKDASELLTADQTLPPVEGALVGQPFTAVHDLQPPIDEKAGGSGRLSSVDADQQGKYLSGGLLAPDVSQNELAADMDGAAGDDLQAADTKLISVDAPGAKLGAGLKVAFSSLLEQSLAGDTKSAPASEGAKPSGVTAASLLAGSNDLAKTLAPSARGFVAQTGIGVNVASPQWNQAVSDKVMWMAAQNISAAEIRLDPPDLGPMQVKVSVHQDQVNVNFTSPHAQVRDALDLQLNRLRDMFSEQGLNLLNVDVSDKSFREQQQDSQQGGKGKGTGGTEDDELLNAQVSSQALSLRLVDHYA